MLTLSPDIQTWFILGGMLLLLVASVLEAMWEFNRVASPRYKQVFMQTGWRYIVLAGWILMLLVGGALMLWAFPLVGIIAITVYWLLLPISVGPRVRRRILPPWDDLRKDLESQGYNEHNYWRRGDWWKEESRRRPPKKKPDSQKSG